MSDTQTPAIAEAGESGLRNRLVFSVLLGLQAGLYGWAALFFRAEDLYMSLSLAALAALFALGCAYMLLRALMKVVTLVRKPVAAEAPAVADTVSDSRDLR